MVTTTDGHSDAVVWVIGDITTSTRLYGFDGDTGAPVYTGGGASEEVQNFGAWITPIEAKGRMYIGANGRVYAFH
jgi:hypothetical protein